MQTYGSQDRLRYEYILTLGHSTHSLSEKRRNASITLYGRCGHYSSIYDCLCSRERERERVGGDDDDPVYI